MPAPQTVLTLIENFERNLDAYRNGQYNETQVRRDFIDPFFKALGWDMDNSLGYAEAYRDVIHEDAIKVGISTRAPDYSFRVGGQRKFFLEAKKPSVSVKDAVEPAFQLRRYAWSAKLPLSIVTDFEEFAIYDCRQKPDKNDKASKSRLFYCTFRDYPEKWDEIAAIFSKDAVLKGSFDKFAVSTKGKRGTTEVDIAFLAEIEGWRGLLARNIALRNNDLSQRELNFAVQQTIDRIIFLRICEDRGIEPYGRLMALQTGVKVYDRLRELFRAADDRYNSGLFHFSKEKSRAGAPDELTLHLEIDDKPLKEIFKNLYYPDCPYEFSVLGADILGSVYEQFLGKVIRLTSGNRAVVEDKPEVKKAGGVFYTPAYIVQYIVQHTVGKLLEGKTSKQAAGIHIVDPACGSGSFLIGAYQYLLDWYLARYVEEGAEKHSKGKAARIHPAAHGEWRLTTAEKKRILLDHIYGVDIDTQAVEVTKLSLLLKVLEGESGESLNSQMKLFQERVLPDLDRNIQCGNSLIGPDFYDSQLDLDEEAAQRINVFDWQAAFPQIFKAGGFDAVIGNPPYIPIFDLAKNQLTYFTDHYKFYSGRYDSYALFIERSLSQLLKPDGSLGLIIPSSLINNRTFQGLRTWLMEVFQFQAIRLLGGKVFQGVNKDTMTVIGQRSAPKKWTVCIEEYFATPYALDPLKRSTQLTKSDFFNGNEFRLGLNTETSFIEKLFSSSQNISLKDVCDSYQGIVTGADEGFIVPSNEAQHFPKSEQGYLHDFLFGSDIARYQTPKNDKQKIIYLTKKEDLAGKAIIEKRLLPFKNVLSKRRESLSGSIPWFALHWPRRQEIFEQPKILIQGIRNLSLPRRIIATLDNSHAYAGVNLVILNLKPGTDYTLPFLLGVLNSNLINTIFRVKFVDHRIKNFYVDSLPIPRSKEESHALREKIAVIVGKLLILHQQLAASKTPQDTTLLQRQIDATDRQIDQLVYTLYGLTDEEIALVEGG